MKKQSEVMGNVERARSIGYTLSVWVGLVVVLLGVGGWNARIEVLGGKRDEEIKSIKTVQKEYSECIKNIQISQAAQAEQMKHIADDQRLMRDDIKNISEFITEIRSEIKKRNQRN